MEPANDEFTGVEFECPKCRARFETYQETCPHCHHELGNEFCASYRPVIPIGLRIVAGLLLIGLILIPVAVFLWRIVWP